MLSHQDSGKWQSRLWEWQRLADRSKGQKRGFRIVASFRWAFSIDIPYSQGNLACVKLTKTLRPSCLYNCPVFGHNMHFFFPTTPMWPWWRQIIFQLQGWLLISLDLIVITQPPPQELAQNPSLNLSVGESVPPLLLTRVDTNLTLSHQTNPWLREIPASALNVNKEAWDPQATGINLSTMGKAIYRPANTCGENRWGRGEGGR